MRIGGLASGMDIDSLVEKMMSAEKAPLNKLYQQKQKYEWQRDAYRDVNKQLASFDKFLLDEMTLQRDFHKQSAKSSNDAVSVTASTSAVGSLTISNITQLATAGSGIGELGKGTAKTTTLKSLSNGTMNGNITMKMKVLQNDGSMKDVTKTFKASDSIENVVKELNKDTGLNAFYDEASGKFSLTTQATGEGVTHNNKNAVSAYVEQGAELFSALGFNDPDGVLTQGGQNAEFTINGATINRSSNTFEINGYNITLNDEYNGSKPITLTSTTDVDAMVDKIKKFVETYNGLVESLKGLTSEKKYRDFLPLTEEQKADMEDKDIEKWEEKAKSGILRSDSIVNSALTSMRSIMYEKGGSSNPLLDSLTEMGITTTKSYLEGGKLEIDENKLREAIAADPHAVSDTFTKSLDSNGNGGIVQKLRESIKSSVATIEKKAGKATMTEQNYSIGKSLLGVDDRINTWKLKLENIESRYWKQFTAMEQAINRANQQSSLFMQGTGGGF